VRGGEGREEKARRGRLSVGSLLMSVLAVWEGRKGGWQRGWWWGGGVERSFCRLERVFISTCVRKLPLPYSLPLRIFSIPALVLREVGLLGWGTNCSVTYQGPRHVKLYMQSLRRLYL